VSISTTRTWLKVKTVQKGKFPVIVALYLGKRAGEDLVYMGKVGNRWLRTGSSQIRKQLDTVISPKSKLTKPIMKPEPRGSNQPLWPKWCSEASRRKACCGKTL
jgi:hypothetical protein